MKLRRCFALRQLIFPLAAGLAIARPALSQETITLTNGQTLQVHVVGVTSDAVRVQIGQAVLGEPFNQIAQMTMNPPPEFAAAELAFEQHDLQTALTDANAVVATYRGIPTDWGRQAMLMVGDIDLSLNQLPQAEAAYQDFQRSYGSGGGAQLDVALAQIDVAKKDFTAAGKKIDPILAQALKNRVVPKAAAALFGRAFYVSGQIKEQSGDLQGALEDYLRTVAIFPQDRVAAVNAEERADSLRKANGIVAP
jgi:tetratricopeptide (TPR) repeat protein